MFVVAGVVAAIATTMGSGQARPKLALGLIFGVIALFMLILFVLQARDVDRAEQASVPDVPRADALSDPTGLAEPELWAALAVEPITPEAVQARQAVWGTVRSSMRLDWIITPLRVRGRRRAGGPPPRARRVRLLPRRRAGRALAECGDAGQRGAGLRGDVPRRAPAREEGRAG
ncbi:MAG TPA: hypothetical protein VGO48_12170 [Conexibacter sp.]|nr:hypothetical protein [Conexibacter sp.]